MCEPLLERYPDFRRETRCHPIQLTPGTDLVEHRRDMAAKFAYESEKLSQARSSLMAPHPFGQDQAFLNAFDFCSRALFKLDIALVDDESARQWIAIIQKTIETTAIEDPKGVGVWQLKLAKLSTAERRSFSDAVDELASYFDREFWVTSE